MKRLSGQEIRQKYKAFFAERGHMVMQSASLVPHDDPTLLWINAGMAPLKPYFDGRVIPENPRIVSSQKCIRTNDIEEVGRTARHQTFFEMLGNFSFGDYFKRETILWAWEFLTKELLLEPDLLSATIHTDDDEAFEIWNKEVGLPASRIFRTGDDNFWEIGEGPCGPCSEIFYDRGEAFGCGESTCQPGCDCDRYLEIWNLVFTQYNKEADGSYKPLPKKNIDTGSGLERLTSVLQDVPNNFETDLFRPIIDATGKLSSAKYGESAEVDIHFKIVADHLRTVAFAISDGVLPGNEGRSYIIRRLLRRAVRSGRRLGIQKPFLHELTSVVSDIMGDDYPDVRTKLAFIARVVKTEEERFSETLAEGENLLQSAMDDLRKQDVLVISGDVAFRLYDTYGFPIDLTIEIAGERGMEVHREGFEALLNEQRDRARAARQTVEGMSSARGVLETITESSTFMGYHELEVATEVTVLIQNGETREILQAGDEGQLLLKETPFYAESGGQIADLGVIVGTSGRLAVIDVKKAPHGQHLHTVRVVSGHVEVGDKVVATVDSSARKDTVKNHTATHLLHKALREVLGDHVSQAGSMVAPERLRFDFSHFGALTQEELTDVEHKVNDAIWEGLPVTIREMDLDDARALGAMALFGEKYGQRVRVVAAADYSVELCGGCHVENTAVIGQFRILSEAGIGSGTRRIEAVTGRYAYEHAKAQELLLKQAAELVKGNVLDVPSRILRTLDDMRKLERDLESAKSQLAHGRARDLLTSVLDVHGIPVLAASVTGIDASGLRQLVDELREKQPSHVIVLGAAEGDRVNFVAAVSKDLQAQKLHAGQLVKEVAAITGGGGGGRPDMAQAGGKDASKLAAAIEAVPRIVARLAGKSEA